MDNNLNETYELMSNKVTETALEVNVNGTMITLAEFEHDYNSINNNITELCIKAHHLAQFNRKVFMDYVINNMGLSRTSAVQMINAGDIYVGTGESLLPVSYTKVAELTPVKEQIDEYSEYIDGLESLHDKTQKEIRESVKAFISLANEQLTNLDEDIPEEVEEIEDVEETPEEVEEIEESIDVTADYLECMGTIEMIKAYLSEFSVKDSEGLIIDSDDVRLCKSFIGNLDLLAKRIRTIMDEGGLSYSDYTASDESEVIDFE